MNIEIRLHQLLELVDESRVQEMELFNGAREEIVLHNISNKEYMRLVLNMCICLKELRSSQNYGSVSELTDLFEIFCFEM